MTATRRLAAILAADVAGYSRLIGAAAEGLRAAACSRSKEGGAIAGSIRYQRNAPRLKPAEFLRR